MAMAPYVTFFTALTVVNQLMFVTLGEKVQSPVTSPASEVQVDANSQPGSGSDSYLLPDIFFGRAFPAPPLARSLALQFGYTAKTYRVVTVDGYKLTLTRLGPSSYNQTSYYHDRRSNRPPVLVLHGTATASGIWLALGPRIAYALRLVDAGFDVWLGDFRGAPASQEHVKLDPNGREYWRFSIHEHALDVSAFVDAVRHFTKHDKILYSGYSLSTQTLFIYCHIRPESCKTKISAAFLMAPTLDVSTIRENFLKFVLELLGASFITLLDALGYVQFPPESVRGISRARAVLLLAARARPPPPRLLALLGVEQEIRQEVLQRVFPEFPLPTALDVYRFLLNTFRTGVFQGLDRGEQENLRRYGSKTPPVYDLKRTTMPVYIVYSGADAVATKQEAKKIVMALPNLAGVSNVHILTHLDFFLSDEAAIAYDRVIFWMRGFLQPRKGVSSYRPSFSNYLGVKSGISQATPGFERGNVPYRASSSNFDDEDVPDTE